MKQTIENIQKIIKISDTFIWVKSDCTVEGHGVDTLKRGSFKHLKVGDYVRCVPCKADKRGLHASRLVRVRVVTPSMKRMLKHEDHHLALAND
jgi:hypothetical protein